MMSISARAEEGPAVPRRQLTLWDSTSIIVGIIIGSSIYESTPLVARSVSGVAALTAAWLLGGLLSLLGALCYAELISAYPADGGDYVYLTRAFGRHAGFLFAWVQFWIVRPGSIGSLAYVFARYANRLWPLGEGPWPLVAYAVASITVLSGINLLGVSEGKWTQNLLTAIKCLGLAAIGLAGFFFGSAHSRVAAAAASAPTGPAGGFGLAMIMILFAYSGWNEMAYVGSELRDPRKNILRALLLGTAAVTTLYLLVNLAFLYALGLAGLRQSEAVAADVLRLGLGPAGSAAISALICVSALGAINGMIFTGSRIYYAMGAEHRFWSWIGQWNARRDAPVRSLVIQAAVTIALVVAFGRREEGFRSSVIFTGPPFWIFFFLVGVALLVLRRREPQHPRPYRVPLYPLVPLVFCLSSGLMTYSSLVYALHEQFYGVLGSIGVAALGLLISRFERRVGSEQ